MKVTFSISAAALCLFASVGDAFIVQQLTFDELCKKYTSSPSSRLHVASDGQSKILMQQGCHRGRVLTSHVTLKDADVPNDNKPQPPVAFRNESSYVLAGAIDDNTTIRQSPSSPYPLLDPPRAVPDPYGWMRDDSRTNATVLAHLEAENEYCRQMTKHLTSLREELYQEFISYTGETDYTCPTAMGEYWYYEIFEKGLSYPRSCRAPRKLEDLYPPEIKTDWNESIPLLPGEEVYLDVPSIARNDTYFAIGAIVVSKNQEYVALSLDETGNEICHFHVRHIASGNEWVLHNNEGKLKGYGAIEWDEVNAGIFYVTLDATQRPYQVYYRRLFESDGSYIEPEKQSDELLFEEQNVIFNIHITKTSDGKYLLVTSTSAESSEVHYIDLQSSDRPVASYLRCIAPRRTNLLYRATHACGYWLLLTNLGNSPNLSLKVCPVGTELDPDGWKDVTLCATGNAVFDGGDQISLDMVTAFIPPSVTSKDRSEPFAYAVVRGREDGLPRVWILELIEDQDANSLATSKSTRLEFNEQAFDVEIGRNLDPSLPYVVITYDSPVTPMSHIAVPLANPEKLGDRMVLKERKVSGYQKHLYVSEKIKIKSRFGHDIPVSLIYRKDALRAGFGNIPVHLYGYGAYGASIEASFQAVRARPLLNRGVVYAIAHVRGGGEMGRHWYDEAKCLNKKNSFRDFVDVARWLTSQSASAKGKQNRQGITSPSKLSIEGRSAGGLLIAAAINQSPDLFQAAILEVPFVDVLSTLIDTTLPLTLAEYDEWGCPNEERYFEYIKSYSPINNVRYGHTYPACLLTGGLFDPRVQYWEPAKFVAELRHNVAKDSGQVLLKMDFNAGHCAGQNRFIHLRELSFNYAFLLDQLGLV